MADGTMYVHESGTRGSPAIVFLQGSGTSGRMWREHTARLARQFHCLAPDLPGFGHSNQMAWHTRAETAALIAALIRDRVPAGSAHVVGLSWGGAIAHTLLDRHPNLVDHAVIDGAGVLTSWNGKLIVLGVVAVSPFLHTRPVTDFFGDIVGMDEEGRSDMRASSTRAFRKAFIEGFKGGCSRVELSAPCPSLFVAGEKETVVRPSNAALAALMPHAAARFVPGLGHGWVGRRTELHIGMVEAWLTDQDLPPELIPEPPAPEAVDRILRQVAATRARE